jgi:hypothetical protein
MPSLTEVANLALAMVGEDRITSLVADTSRAAQLCNALLPQARDAALVMHPWNFAARRASLPALATAPISEWDYQYAVPANCLRVLRVVADDPHQPWAREGGVILCNLAAPLEIRYIAEISDSGSWSPGFVDLVAVMLAERLAVSLTASQSIRAAIVQLRDDALRRARAIDAAEGTPDPAYAPASVFVEARY